MSLTFTGFDLKFPTDLSSRLAGLDERRRSLDLAVQDYAREVQDSIRPLLGTTAAFDASCENMWQKVLAGKTSEMHAMRDEFLATFQEHLARLQSAVALAQHVEQMTGHVLPDTKTLASESETLEKRIGKLRLRWQSAEDLEDLAAESIALPHEKLKALRQKQGFPQAWYDEDSKPF